MDLNAQQRACAEHSGNLLVSAVPGSGKTRTLVSAIEHRVTGGHVAGSRVLAVAFTRNAAAQMRARLEGVDVGIQTCTFHSLCFALVTGHYRELDYPDANIAIYDRVEQRRLVDETLRTSGRHSCTARRAIDLLDHRAAHGELPPDVSERERGVILRYESALRAHRAICYSTLPTAALEVVADMDVRPWHEVYVDECQDIDHIQFTFFAALRARRYFFVGDCDQLIYGWRGAHWMTMQQLKAEFGCDERTLTLNYRSTQPICDDANRLIAHNDHRAHRHRMEAVHTDGQHDPCCVSCFHHVSHPCERCGRWQGYDVDATTVVESAEFAEAVRAATRDEGTVAVLSRTNRILVEAEIELRRHGMQPTMVGRREKLLERLAVKEVLAYLVFPALPMSPVMAERVLQREGVTQPDIERVRRDAKQVGRTFFDVAIERHEGLRELYGEFDDVGISEQMAMAVAHVNRRSPERMSPQDRSQLATLVAQFARWEPKWANRTPDRFLAWLNLRDGQDEVDLDAPLQLMTIHAAKGLEFDHVFVVGLAEGILPSSRATGDDGLQEERRLMYVAMTRARRTLTYIVPHENVSRFVHEAKSAGGPRCVFQLGDSNCGVDLSAANAPTCDKSLEDCRRWGNEVRFGGFRDTPA